MSRGRSLEQRLFYRFLDCLQQDMCQKVMIDMHSLSVGIELFTRDGAVSPKFISVPRSTHCLISSCRVGLRRATFASTSIKCGAALTGTIASTRCGCNSVTCGSEFAPMLTPAAARHCSHTTVHRFHITIDCPRIARDHAHLAGDHTHLILRLRNVNELLRAIMSVRRRLACRLPRLGSP